MTMLSPALIASSAARMTNSYELTCDLYRKISGTWTKQNTDPIPCDVIDQLRQYDPYIESGERAAEDYERAPFVIALPEDTVIDDSYRIYVGADRYKVVDVKDDATDARLFGMLVDAQHING